IADELRDMGSLAPQRMLHVMRPRPARDGRDQAGQTPLVLPAGHFLAIEEVAVGMAHAEEQVNRPAARVAAHEARERPDAGPRADQDQRRPARPRTEAWVAAEEGGYGIARLHRRELSRAEAAGMLLHHDLDEAVAASGGERV